MSKERNRHEWDSNLLLICFYRDRNSHRLAVAGDRLHPQQIGRVVMNALTKVLVTIGQIIAATASNDPEAYMEPEPEERQKNER